MKKVKKITKLSTLKKLNKVQLLDEMMKGTIKGGSSCARSLRDPNSQDPMP